MLFILTRRWWIALLKGICATLCGLMIVAWTKMPVSSVVISFGVYCLTDGMLSLALARGSKTGMNKLQRELRDAGLVSVCAGTVALLWSDMSIEWLSIVAALWAIWRGICEFVASSWLRKIIPGERLLFLVGMVSILCNCTLLMSFLLQMPATRWIIAGFIVIRGGLFIAMGLELRGYRHAFDSHPFLQSNFSRSFLQHARSTTAASERVSRRGRKSRPAGR